MKKLLCGALLLVFSAPAFAMSGVSTQQLQQAQAVLCDVSAVATVAGAAEADVGVGGKVATRTTTVQAASADLCAQLGGVVTALAPASAN